MDALLEVRGLRTHFRTDRGLFRAVDGIDLTGVTDAGLASRLEAEAAVNLKRFTRPVDEDWSERPHLRRLSRFIETKTVWHPMGV